MTKAQAKNSEAHKAFPPHSMARPCAWFWPWLVVLLGLVWPRLLSLGGFPHMDEGFYAYWAQYMHQSLAQGHGLPNVGGLLLYSIIFSPLCALPGNALLWLRLGDLVVSAGAGGLLCRLLERESRSAVGGLLLGLIFLCALNTPDAVDSGFKHSFFAAWAALFGALLLAPASAQSSDHGPAQVPGQARWLVVGALTALAVLLREPFFIFAFLGAAAVWLGRGWGAFWRYALGGILGSICILGVVCLVRGGVAGLVQAYLDAGANYAPEAARVWPNFFYYAQKTLNRFWPLLVLSLLSLSIVLLSPRRRALAGRTAFWLAAALLPVLEPLSKLGFLYHFAAGLPGCAGLCALAWREAAPVLARPAWLRCVALSVLGLAGLWQWNLFLPLEQGRMSLEAVRAFPQMWSQADVARSNTLLAGQAVQKLLPEGGSLSSSAFTYFLYPATGLLPSSPGLSDLSRTFITANFDVPRLSQVLRANPPDVLAVGFTSIPHAASYTREILAAVEDSGLYALKTTIPVDASKNYGWMGYYIFQKTPGGQGVLPN